MNLSLLKLAKPMQRMSPGAGRTQEEWDAYCVKWEASIYENNVPFRNYLLRVSEELNKIPGIRTYVQQYSYQLGYFLKVESWDKTWLNNDLDISWVQEYAQGAYRELVNHNKFARAMVRISSSPVGALCSRIFIQMLEDGEIQFLTHLHFNGDLVEVK